MAKFRYMFTFPTEQIREPVIYNVGKQFNIITNIRRAEIEHDHAWAVLELEGEDDEIEKALAYVRGLGLLVNQMEGDVITG
jgi:ABC-type methionine transport system ATPase subunit